jgi:hypothetical protein
MFYDSVGALLVTKSEGQTHFGGSIVKMYPEGTTLTLRESGVNAIKNGTVFVHKLH